VRHAWLVAADLDGKTREATIYLAAPVDIADIEHDLAHLIHTSEEALWDDKRGTVIARRLRKLGELVLEEKELAKPDPALIQQGLLNAIRNKGLASLPWTETATQWCARVKLLAKVCPDDWAGCQRNGFARYIRCVAAAFFNRHTTLVGSENT